MELLIRKKHQLLVGFSLLIFGLSLGLFIQASDTEDQKAKQGFEQAYHVYSIELPASLTFANEKISLQDPDVLERYDRELLTNVYYQSQMLLYIKRAGRFFPTIELILKEQQIPQDFKYLAVAESGLQLVVSPAGAAGYWQFLDKTGKHYGLEVNEEVDERYHLEKSTLAACAYFKDAYDKFGSWALVAASYNMGIEGVRRQMNTQHLNTYEDLYLNTETSRYLFRILAIKEVMENPEKYGFHVPFNQRYKEPETVTLLADISISSLVELAHDNASNYKLIKWYNPWLRKPFLNVSPGKSYAIKWPASKVSGSPLANKISNGFLKLSDMQTDSIAKTDVIGVITHQVMPGENIERIARKYRIGKEAIIEANQLNPALPLKPNQLLIIQKVEDD
jgi:membrane-bound lytic murein transglycosylase D